MRNLLRGRSIVATAAVLAVAVCVFAQDAQQTGLGGATAGNPLCGSATFLVFEQGKLAAVDWADRSTNGVHTRVIATQSQIVDVTIDLRADETAARSSAVLSIAGENGEGTKAARDLGEGAIYWSPRIPSSIEQAIARARVLENPYPRLSAHLRLAIRDRRSR